MKEEKSPKVSGRGHEDLGLVIRETGQEAGEAFRDYEKERQRASKKNQRS